MVSQLRPFQTLIFLKLMFIILKRFFKILVKVFPIIKVVIATAVHVPVLHVTNMIKSRKNIKKKTAKKETAAQVVSQKTSKF